MHLISRVGQQVQEISWKAKRISVQAPTGCLKANGSILIHFFSLLELSKRKREKIQMKSVQIQKEIVDFIYLFISLFAITETVHIFLYLAYTLFNSIP